MGSNLFSRGSYRFKRAVDEKMRGSALRTMGFYRRIYGQIRFLSLLSLLRGDLRG